MNRLPISISRIITPMPTRRTMSTASHIHPQQMRMAIPRVGNPRIGNRANIISKRFASNEEKIDSLFPRTVIGMGIGAITGGVVAYDSYDSVSNDIIVPQSMFLIFIFSGMGAAVSMAIVPFAIMGVCGGVGVWGSHLYYKYNDNKENK